MIKSEVMNKFGFSDIDEFDTLLLDLNVNPETEDLTDAQVEIVKNHVTVFASTLAALPAAQSENNGHYTTPSSAMPVVTNQGLQVAKEAGLEISSGALETLCQMTFDKGRLDAAFLENAYWLGLLRQQNQLRTANTQKFVKLLRDQQNQNINIEKLAADAGLLSNEELVKKLSVVAATSTANNNLNDAIAVASSW
jgi:hypothetical protein